MLTTEISAAEARCRAHVMLMEELRNLDETANAGMVQSLPALRIRLRTVEEQILEHFRFEEENGYMKGVRRGAPHLERAVQQLGEEHCQLAEMLRELLEKARKAMSLDNGLLDGVRTWVKRVRQHEIRENELIQDAFSLDIGVGD